MDMDCGCQKVKTLNYSYFLIDILEINSLCVNFFIGNRGCLELM